MSSFNSSASLQKFKQFWWVILLVTLPVTSFPYFPQAIGGQALVRPLVIYPLLILMVVFTIPYIISKRLPNVFLPLIAFIIIAIISSTVAVLQNPDPWLGVDSLGRGFRVLITLAIGSVLYFTISLYPESLIKLKSALKWIYIGMSTAMLFGSFQAYAIITNSKPLFQIAKRIHKIFSTRNLIPSRVSGITFEPNWFAEQLSILLIPWLLASILSGFTVFKWHYKKITVEMFLIVWAVFNLVFTYSRAGLLITFVVVVVAFLFLRMPSAKFTKRNTGSIVRRVIEITVIIVILSSLVFFAGQRNQFFSRLWGYFQQTPEFSVESYLKYLGFEARLIYARAGYDIYQENPILGVGLGNYALYFSDVVKAEPLALYPEVERIITPEVGGTRLITPKNFFIRLLAETGLFGLLTFITFLMVVFGSAVYLRLSSSKEIKFWGTAGILAIIAFMVNSVSTDSFAIPNLWVILGLITASTRLANISTENDPPTGTLPVGS